MKKYEKFECLGQGTYGTVYRGINKETGQQVAIKKIMNDDEGVHASCIREISIVKEFAHQNIVRLYDIFFAETNTQLVFEYAQADLKKYLKMIQDFDASEINSCNTRMIPVKPFESRSVAILKMPPRKGKRLDLSKCSSDEDYNSGSSTKSASWGSDSPKKGPTKEIKVSNNEKEKEPKKELESAPETVVETTILPEKTPFHHSSISVPSWRLDPRRLQSIIRQIIQGVQACHEQTVIHRDLKPQNILVCWRETEQKQENGDDDPLPTPGTPLIPKKQKQKQFVHHLESGIPPEIKLADFGLARSLYTINANATCEVQTIWYRCPELLNGQRNYSNAIDMWSVGCIMSELLHNRPLFPGSCEKEQFEMIVKTLGCPPTTYTDSQKFVGNIRNPKNIDSLESRHHFGTHTLAIKEQTLFLDLLYQLLEYDPSKRITAAQALDHLYFKLEF